MIFGKGVAPMCTAHGDGGETIRLLQGNVLVAHGCPLMLVDDGQRRALSLKVTVVRIVSPSRSTTTLPCSPGLMSRRIYMRS